MVYPANALDSLVCEVIRYRLVQVRKNLKKNPCYRHFFMAFIDFQLH